MSWQQTCKILPRKKNKKKKWKEKQIMIINFNNQISLSICLNGFEKNERIIIIKSWSKVHAETNN